MNQERQNPAFDTNPVILDSRMVSLINMTNNVMMKIKQAQGLS
ncbi:hypothetical protein BD31_I1496 [Candidatus Nitrosopumilus salaria BD31]|uniref:Uncharacterized protein n=1 Tax=Candidatus Nitrosopumilus salarius BD31 TaxID=859350 RepID=I3D3N6_9ARCH|nr:hypothetical protein [Candidatus Nitrosopumilus salaria]EIJ66329.1 hypothetical protein BD31_I1496 [Candidatus Nitrosopumilus salaria BD31]